MQLGWRRRLQRKLAYLDVCSKRRRRRRRYLPVQTLVCTNPTRRTNLTKVGAHKCSRETSTEVGAVAVQAYSAHRCTSGVAYSIKLATALLEERFLRYTAAAWMIAIVPATLSSWVVVSGSTWKELPLAGFRNVNREARWNAVIRWVGWASVYMHLNVVRWSRDTPFKCPPRRVGPRWRMDFLYVRRPYRSGPKNCV